jgi:ubiquinone/menaquinone biosynthesis C-methylase UbiE
LPVKARNCRSETHPAERSLPDGPSGNLMLRGQIDAKEFYDRLSTIYYGETFDHDQTLTSLGRRVRTLRVLDVLNRRLSRHSVVADLGCGPAQFASPLLLSGHKYIGLDISAEMFSETAARLEGNPQALFLQGSVERIPLPDESVDAVICIGVIEYLPQNVTALAEIHRILKKPGLAIVSFPSLRFPMLFVRAILRPILGPALRTVLPRLRRTVYVSGIEHRTIRPKKFVREAEQSGFRLQEQSSHVYFPLLFNHRIRSAALPLYLGIERLGEKIVPGMGANFIVCLEA